MSRFAVSKHSDLRIVAPIAILRIPPALKSVAFPNLAGQGKEAGPTQREDGRTLADGGACFPCCDDCIVHGNLGHMSGAVRDRIIEKLSAAFSPRALEVRDESHLHQGHVGARPEGETHFRVEVESDAFAGQSRVARHRAINAALAEELAGPVHALAIAAFAPGEARPERGRKPSA